MLSDEQRYLLDQYTSLQTYWKRKAREVYNKRHNLAYLYDLNPDKYQDEWNEIEEELNRINQTVDTLDFFIEMTKDRYEQEEKILSVGRGTTVRVTPLSITGNTVNDVIWGEVNPYMEDAVNTRTRLS